MNELRQIHIFFCFYNQQKKLEYTGKNLKEINQIFKRASRKFKKQNILRKYRQTLTDEFYGPIRRGIT